MSVVPLILTFKARTDHARATASARPSTRLRSDFVDCRSRAVDQIGARLHRARDVRASRMRAVCEDVAEVDRRSKDVCYRY